MQVKSNKKCPKCNRNLYTSIIGLDEAKYSCLHCDFEKVVKIKNLVNVDYSILQRKEIL